jgi:trigger factor
MEIQITASGPCRKTVSIKIPPEKIRTHVDEVFKSAQGQVTQKGFRPGKVPRAVLEKKFGPAILAEAKEKLVQESFQEAVREHKLAVIGRPTVNGIDEKPLDPTVPLQFEVAFDVRPEFELKSVKGLEVAAGDPAVTDADMESALNSLADQKKTLREVQEPVGTTDFAKGDLVYRDAAGASVVEKKGIQLNPGIPVAGSDPEKFASALTGAEKGATVRLELTFPPNFEKPELRGQAGTLEFTVAEVLRVAPAPLDDEFAKGFEFETLDAMKEELRNRIADEKVRANKVRQEDDILRILIAEHTFDLPQSLVDDQAEHALSQFGQRLKQNGMPDEEIQTRLESSKEDARKDAEQRVRVFFLIDAIARREKIFVTENDVDTEIRNVAAQHNAAPDEVRRHFESNGMISDLRIGIMERKVRDFLRENAKLSDKQA